MKCWLVHGPTYITSVNLRKILTLNFQFNLQTMASNYFDQNREMLEESLLQDELVQHSEEPHLFDQTYLESGASGDIIPLLMLDLCTAQNNHSQFISQGLLTSLRLSIRKIITSTKVLLDHSRPEDKSLFEEFELVGKHRVYCRKLMRSRLFARLQEAEILIFMFYYWKQCGNKLFGIIEGFC